MEMLFLFGCVLALVLLNVPIAVALGVVAVVAIVMVIEMSIVLGGDYFSLEQLPLPAAAAMIRNAMSL